MSTNQITKGPFSVFTCAPCGVVKHFAVADWDESEQSGERERSAPLARFDVSRRHQEAEQLQRASWFCDVLNRQWAARQAISLKEFA